MKILAIETSCDDTAAAIVEGMGPKASLRDLRVLVSLVASQEKLHAKFGGIVPEVASRQHLEAIYPLIEMALVKVRLSPKQIDAIAVTTHPGLLGSLLVGVNAAKTLGYLWGKPVISVNHLLGHIYAGWLGDEKIKYPLVSLVTSGGHSEIVLTRSKGEYKYVGGTRDDAAGEAFDKVARILGLGYPGGPAVALRAMAGSASKIHLPRPMIDESNFDFSFSGLKTATATIVAISNNQYPITKGRIRDIAWEFQEAVVEVLVRKLFGAARKYKAKTILIGGGVAANKRLREEVQRKAGELGLKVVIPEFKYCTDNAAMIGAAAYVLYKKGRGAGRLVERSETRLRRHSSRGNLGVPSRFRWYNANVVTD